MHRRLAVLFVLAFMVLFGSAAEAQNTPPDSSIALRGGLGRTTLIGKAKSVCQEVRAEFDDLISEGAGFNCNGDDSGMGWAVGAEYVRRLGMSRWDIGGRVDFTRPSNITINHSLTFGSQALITDTLTRGWKLGLAPQVGFRASDRVRVYGGFGARHFDFETEGRARFGNEMETFEGMASGWARRLYGGAEYTFWRGSRSQLGAYGEGERHWLKDSDEDFEATESELLFGVVYRFGLF